MGATAENSYATVRFILDGETIELSNVDPTRTVLQYLREDLRRTGTKEGCAEGDCGACTVVLLELDKSGDRVQLRAVNSCIQFLPTLDGRELITVESLRASDGTLHPVQKAMVECHGSQCGFCTPGFVMSLFVHYKTSGSTRRRDIDDLLAGNLCRCTGYQPIIDAAQKMFDIQADVNDWRCQANTSDASAQDNDKAAALRSIQRAGSLAIDNGKGRFYAPRSVNELAEIYSENPDATLLAGGTDIGLWVTKQHRHLPVVIYTGEVDELRDCVVGDDIIDIGAAVTLSEVMPLLDQHYPDLKDLFLRFASPPIRNAGTLGGNIANGSPIGDSMPALLALDAKLVLRAGDSRRIVLLNDFYLGYQKTALAGHEFVERIHIPLSQEGAMLRSYKVCKRFDQDISAVCAAYCIVVDGGTVTDARIAYGGVAEIPKRALLTEAALSGAVWSEETIRKAKRCVLEDFQPISDMRASADYRLAVCQNLLQRLWLDCTESGVTTDIYGYGR